MQGSSPERQVRREIAESEHLVHRLGEDVLVR